MNKEMRRELDGIKASVERLRELGLEKSADRLEGELNYIYMCLGDDQ